MNINLAEATWDTIENINRGLCEHGRAAFSRNEEGYAKAKDLWNNRQSQSSLLEVLELAHKCHRLAPFLNYNGNTFVSVVRTVIEHQPQISRIKLNAMRSLAWTLCRRHHHARKKTNFAHAVKQRKCPVENWRHSPNFDGNRAGGGITEILPDGNVLYKSTQGKVKP
jgi:hypothetical protein